jgi:hypothetical protein
MSTKRTTAELEPLVDERLAELESSLANSIPNGPVNRMTIPTPKTVQTMQAKIDLLLREHVRNQIEREQG